ncbi:MAG TPA: hypothetical protein VKR24_14135 [Candidatus Limnocylindrales bacterium]|nr:hypothetical protein [Candidatus Limnocylindrales bacterium]
MDDANESVIPRSSIAIGLDPRLRASFGQLAAGRVLVIDYFASRRCSLVISDLTCQFRPGTPAGDFIELAPIEGVRIFIEARLRATLAASGPSLRTGGLPFARHLAIELDRPEHWIQFLDGPGVLAGKQRFRLRHLPTSERRGD